MTTTPFIRTVSGDLISMANAGLIEVLVHGCNCMCTMGAGFAKQIRVVFPEAYRVDAATERASRSKLGSFSSCRVQRGQVSLVIVNAYTQYSYSTQRVAIDYDAFRRCLIAIRSAYSQKHIGMPKIGSGLAGGDWPTLFAIIREVMCDCRVTIVEYQPSAS